MPENGARSVNGSSVLLPSFPFSVYAVTSRTGAAFLVFVDVVQCCCCCCYCFAVRQIQKSETRLHYRYVLRQCLEESSRFSGGLCVSVWKILAKHSQHTNKYAL